MVEAVVHAGAGASGVSGKGRLLGSGTASCDSDSGSDVDLDGDVGPAATATMGAGLARKRRKVVPDDDLVTEDAHRGGVGCDAAVGGCSLAAVEELDLDGEECVGLDAGTGAADDNVGVLPPGLRGGAGCAGRGSARAVAHGEEDDLSAVAEADLLPDDAAKLRSQWVSYTGPASLQDGALKAAIAALPPSLVPFVYQAL